MKIRFTLSLILTIVTIQLLLIHKVYAVEESAATPSIQQSPRPDTQDDAPPPLGNPVEADAPPPHPAPEPRNLFQQFSTGFDEPANRNLVQLVGVSEVAVQADVDGHYVENLTAHRLFDDEAAVATEEINLPDSVLVGRSFNRSSRAVQSRVEQAQAQSGQALGLLLPSISIRASRGYETSEPSVEIDPATGEPYTKDNHMRSDAALTIRQPLFDLPAFLDWRRRKVVETARGENYRESDGDAYVAAIHAYLSLVSSRLQVDMTRDFEAQLDELRSYIEKRASAGAASVSDMARVKARAQATLSTRLEQEAAHAAAGIEFVQLTNLVPRKVRLPVLEELGTAQLPGSFGAAVGAAMKSNPEIASLAAEVRAAKVDIAAAKGRFLPRVDAEYTDTYSVHAGGDTSTTGQRDRRSMLIVNWSPLSGGSDYRYHAERVARYQELRYRLDDQRRQVIQSLSANYALLATTRERIASGYQELMSIATAADAMSRRMLSGNQSLLDLLDVYDRFYQARSRLITLHILEISTTAQLVRLVYGTPETATLNTAVAMRAQAEIAPEIEPVKEDGDYGRTP